MSETTKCPQVEFEPVNFVACPGCESASGKLAAANQRIAELEGIVADMQSHVDVGATWAEAALARSYDKAIAAERAAHEETKLALHKSQGECGHLQADLAEVKAKLAKAERLLAEYKQGSEVEAIAGDEARESSPPRATTNQSPPIKPTNPGIVQFREGFNPPMSKSN